METVRIDATDRRILEILQGEGRLPNARIAERVGLSPPSVLERIRKLEEKGVIRGYTALVDGRRLGLRTEVYVAVALSFHRQECIDEFREAILSTPQVLECHHLTGEDDFLLRVVVPEIEDYEDFLLHTLTRIECVSKVKSAFVLSTLKREARLPLPESP
ncbi:MAG: Lrp/AsnC family transcriptional regulator [Candidatus Krumholzibacteriia bacterium]|nr:Lrp/AsnC family transcriptional regulator [bacterium]MCB9513362.1 Lrp/AsnC family transcriptional regulator [Candidatus Latescibacterota bacterium]MCB9516076.1 Lrp/AsnC family transcriptional regulator [Candidatus Latescibacterota bacterium]